jgi:hypothetical protein
MSIASVVSSCSHLKARERDALRFLPRPSGAKTRRISSPGCAHRRRVAPAASRSGRRPGHSSSSLPRPVPSLSMAIRRTSVPSWCSCGPGHQASSLTRRAPHTPVINRYGAHTITSRGLSPISRLAATPAITENTRRIVHRPIFFFLNRTWKSSTIQRRIDSSDVLQEAHLEVARRAREYLEKRTMPPYLWFRFVTSQALHWPRSS